MDNPRQEIMAFLGRFFRCESLGSDADIFAAGFVNSLVLVQLIRFLEINYAITIDDDDLEIENFRTVNQILSLVTRKSVLKSQESACAVESTVDAS